jgi:hypothetical protein
MLHKYELRFWQNCKSNKTPIVVYVVSTSSSLMGGFQRFGGTDYHHLQG